MALAALFGRQAQLRLLGGGLLIGSVSTLLGFEHETAPLVQVNPAGGLFAAAIVKRYGPLQHVLVLGGVVGGGVGAGYTQ